VPLLIGNTYPLYKKLKELGGHWDKDAKGWQMPEAVFAEAQALLMDNHSFSCPKCGNPESHPTKNLILIRAFKVDDWSQCLVCAGHFDPKTLEETLWLRMTAGDLLREDQLGVDHEHLGQVRPQRWMVPGLAANSISITAERRKEKREKRIDLFIMLRC